MTPFAYHRAADRAEALSLAGNGRFLSGGTNLVDLMRQNVERPAALVDVSGLSAEIRETDGGGLLIDAGHGFWLGPGDAVVLPNDGYGKTAMHSVFCASPGPTYALSIALREARPAAPESPARALPAGAPPPPGPRRRVGFQPTIRQHRAKELQCLRREFKGKMKPGSPPPFICPKILQRARETASLVPPGTGGHRLLTRREFSAGSPSDRRCRSPCAPRNAPGTARNPQPWQWLARG